jgi:hypothetical protein
MRMKIIKLILVMALGLVICLPAVASAYTVSGTWQEAGSENAQVPFTKIEVFVIDANTMTGPALINLNRSSWTSTLINDKYSLAEGPAPGTLNFNLQLPGSGTTPVEIEYLVWNGDVLNSTQDMIFTGSKYSFPTGTRAWGYYDGDGIHDFYGNLLPSREDPPQLLSAVVPLPPSALLFGSGLLGLGFLPWRKKIKA